MLDLFSPEVPVLLIGAPGTGKTARVQAQFDHAELVLTSTLVEEDIGGLPYREGDYDYRTTPAVFRRLHAASAAGRTTVLFLDELDKARRSVADTLLTLVASRRIGNAELPASTCIVAAANPPELGGGDGISEAMQSRFATIDYVPDVGAWESWARTQFSGEAADRVIAAVASGELPLFDLVGDGLSRRLTSPRTLAMALRSLVRCGPTSTTLEMVVKGLLTPAVASQFLHLVRQQPNEVLAKAVSSVRRSAARGGSPSVLRL